MAHVNVCMLRTSRVTKIISIPLLCSSDCETRALSCLVSPVTTKYSHSPLYRAHSYTATG